MLKKELSDLRRNIIALGVKSGRKYGILFGVYCFVLIFLTFQLVLIFFYKWDYMNKRMEALKGFLMYLGCMEYVTVILFNYNGLMNLLDILEEGFTNFPNKPTQRRLDLQQRILDDTNNVISVWSLIQNAMVALMILPSIIVLIVQIWTTDFWSISIDKLSIPLAFYFPTEYSTLPIYLLVLTIQCFFFQQTTHLIIVIVISPCIAMLQIEGEFKLLGLSLEEFDHQTFSGNSQDSKYLHLGTQYRTDEVHHAIATLKGFIQQQQYIYRKIQKVTRRIQLATFYVDTLLQMLLSLSIYTVAKNKDWIMKLQDSIFGCFVVYCLYCYHMPGEKVTIEHEKVRDALYQTTWFDKPLLYKKWLLCVMTRMNTTAEIKRTGMFSLNLRNFVVTVRAGYSIFNILTKF